MRASLLTIPLDEIMDPKCGCPICRMRDMLEERAVEYIMGAAMMEPDVRIETNKQGFCKEHFEMMRKGRNSLPLALVIQSHLQYIQKNIYEHKSVFEKKDAKKKKVSAINNDCFICNKIEWGMSRILVTFFEMFEKDKNFRNQFDEQEMLCLPHYEMLIEQSENNMDKKYQKIFIDSCNKLVGKYLDTLIKDVSHYCDMYDYHNADSNDWGNSKDSIERTIKFLTTR